MTRNHYEHRPPYLRASNFVGRIAGLDKRLTLDPDRLIVAAQERAGLMDFGSMSWRAGFDRLCASLEDEARLNLVGRLSARSHLSQLLQNRLRMQAEQNRQPTAPSIRSPVIITGLPRSGSTLLHGLLAQDPGIRVPWTWEVMLPCRLPGHRVDERQDRIRRTNRMLNWVDRLAPRFRTVHPVGAELPQECIAITAHEFASVEFHTTFDVPSYQNWLDRQDGLAAIRFHHRFLLHLDGGTDVSGRRWFLKAPAHLYNLPALAAVYPDARFVFTHRAPEKVAASIASHGVILRSAFSDQVDVKAVAEFWLHWWAEGWRRAQRFRNEQAVIDLDYETLVRDPIAAVRDLYAGLDMSLSETARQHMQAFLAANPQDKHGLHRYTLNEFGLAAADVRLAFDT